MPIHLQHYFERINYKGGVTISETTLKEIHLAQVTSIPFENLSIHEVKNADNKDAFIKLDEDALFQKLVIEKRGGYCHENNELLALVLIQMGFKVDRLAARVLTADNLPITHKLLLVTIGEQRWIADVGFGAYGFFEPIPLIADKDVSQYGDTFKLVLADQQYTLQMFVKNDWKNLYEFTTQPYKAIDFEPMSYYVSHDPGSIFVKNRVSVLLKAGETGERMILFNSNLKIIKQNEEKTTAIVDEKMFVSVLKNTFRIDIPQNTLWQKKSEAPEFNGNNFFAKNGLGLLPTPKAYSLLSFQPN